MFETLFSRLRPRLRILVDFENLPLSDLVGAASAADRVFVFLGKGNSKLPVKLVKAGHRLGRRLRYIQLDQTGRNALDFHIAYFLGDQIARAPGHHYLVVSKDRGYDPLIEFLVSQGHRVERVAALPETLGEEEPTAKPVPSAAPAHLVSEKPRRRTKATPAIPPAPPEEAPVRESWWRRVFTGKKKGSDGALDERADRVIDVMRRTSERSRPRRMKTLRSHVAALFHGSLSMEETDALIEALRSRGVLDVDGHEVRFSLEESAAPSPRKSSKSDKKH